MFASKNVNGLETEWWCLDKLRENIKYLPTGRELGLYQVRTEVKFLRELGLPLNT